ncbi:MAG TPA: POTRA domain-containing protein, partial [Polyangia bacterium]|nr:POTRA domain-containing protein [Polyangia bacterium]
MALAVGGLVAAVPRARAAEDEPVPPAEATVDPEPSVPMAGFEITGALVEPLETIEALLKAVAPPGAPFVPSGPADRVGTPIGTIPRLQKALEGVGYDATLQAVTGPGGITIRAQLRPYDRVRYIFVSGNGTIRQDEIQRRITIRTGHPLPMPGPERDASMERERQRLIRFLRDEEGYFEANVRIDLQPHGASPAAVDLNVHISRGPGYPIGPIAVDGNNNIPT